MKALILYRSKTGYTKKYGEWIKDELSADCFEVSTINSNILDNYDTIIYGGGLYEHGINGINFVLQNFDSIKTKKVVIFAVGTSPDTPETVNAIRDTNFVADQQKYIKLFYLRGGFDYTKLSHTDKILMNLLKLKLKAKRNPTSDTKRMLASYNTPVSYINKKYIEPIISYINL